MRKFLIAIGIVLAAGVAGCASNDRPSGETVGTVGGAVAGGAIGSVATGGSTVGTIGGAIIGGAVGNEAGERYDERKGRR
jgi:osmotically inducible lipoprotein OsmB